MSYVARIIVAVVTAVFCQVVPLQAQVSDWSNSSGAPNPWYNDGFNWGGTANSSVPTSSEIARFNLSNTYEVWWGSPNDPPSVGFLEVLQGDVTFLQSDQTATVQQEFTINGSGSFTDFSVCGPTTALTNRGLHLRSLGGAQVADAGTLTLDGSHTAGSRLTVVGNAGFQIDGTLNIESGGKVFNTDGFVGENATGQATVTGVGSEWINTRNLTLFGSIFMDAGEGSLSVASGGRVQVGNDATDLGASSEMVIGSNQSDIEGNLYVGAGSTISNDGNARIGDSAGYTGGVTFNGVGSQWDNVSSLSVGVFGEGRLHVEDGATVNNSSGFVGEEAGSVGLVDVTGVNSVWNNSGNLIVGLNGTATLDVIDGGRVTVGGTTSIGLLGTVNMSGATSRFEFGQTAFEDFTRINATEGSLAGEVQHSGFTNVATQTSLQNTGVTMDDVSLTNAGTLYGNASLAIRLNNTATGEVETTAGERMRFAGAINTNSGEINNFGGQIRFDGTLTNNSGGFIGGRGQFIADGGWANHGVMAFTGTTDVLGDVTNGSVGQIVTSGGATTTFFDDVVHHGSEIRTSADSGLVFLGEFTGAGPFTGSGTVYFEGDLRPGNSPDVLSFGGNVSLAESLTTYIELGGINEGQYDWLQIAGDASIGGDLEVSLWNGFQLENGMEFMFTSIGGTATGLFNGLGEGARVGTYSGTDLFIGYSRGDGNDIALYTISAVPEPTAVVMMTCGLGMIGLPRRRRKLKPGSVCR